MAARLICALLALSLPLSASDKGYCPTDMPQPPGSAFTKKSVGQKAKNGDQIKTATLFLVISDKGYVCNARVLQGVNKELDAKAVEVVQTWTFRPAMKDGHPVPVAVTVQVNFRMNQGEPVVDPTPSPTPPAPNP